MQHRHYAAALALLVFAACRPPFEFEPWALPVDPEGAALIGYGATVREGTVRLIEDAAIGGVGDDPGALFGRSPPRLAVADDGTLLVLDGSNHRIQIFDAAGRLTATVGGRGQGPGEFAQPLELFIAANMLQVWDAANRRLSQFRPDGAFIEDRPTGSWGGMIVPYAAGEMVWRRTERTEGGTLVHVRRVAADGDERVLYATMPWPLRTIDPPLAEIVNTEADAWWTGTVPPAFAAGPDGIVYVSPFADYQVFAYQPDGALRWALQVAVERPRVSQVEIDFHMATHRRRFPDRVAAQIDWPDRAYALADLKVDGHGHLYVFPYVAKGTSPDAPRPVDVYDAQGQRLFSGEIDGRLGEAASATYNGPMYEVAWQVARGDSVWGVARSDPDGDWQVVRYRLQEPF